MVGARIGLSNARSIAFAHSFERCGMSFKLLTRTNSLNRGCVPWGVSLILFALFAWPARAEIQLPTPLEHYESYRPSREALQLLTNLMSELDPSMQQMVLQFLDSSGSPGTPRMSKSEARVVLRSVNWKKWRQQILELLMHHSHVLDTIPAKSKDWTPIAHDALLFFLDRLDEERLFERLLDFAYLPQDSQRGERIQQFASQTPTLQKIGQILARNPGVPPDVRKALQTFENSLRTTRRDDLVEFINQEIGPETVEKYQIEFSEEILAEGSVGTVIRASLILPRESDRQEAVCKVIKPYVLKALPEELSIINELTHYFSAHRDFYQLGAIPLSEMFQDLREALSKEIRMAEEQRNLARAGAYYRGHRGILIQAIYPFSTEHVLFMEFVRGEKITAAFAGDARRRAKLARRLSDALTFDVIFSPQDEALFHGDPHAGNVFHVLKDPDDPLRIALLDWGLMGVLPRQQRAQLLQLVLGIHLKNTKRLRNNLGALIEGGLPQSPEKLSRIHLLAKETLRERENRGIFETLGMLMEKLAKEGYQVPLNINLFIKAQVTIAGILCELDPEFRQDAYILRRASKRVMKESPRRFLRTLWFPAWNSHDYRSMVSNEDVKDLFVKQFGRLMKKAGGVGVKRPRESPCCGS